MKKLKSLNGKIIPYDLPTSSLVEMLKSQEMSDFCVACEALSYRENIESFDAIKSFLYSNDKYRRLYAFKSIFRMSFANSLINYLEEQLKSPDYLFVSAALHIIIDKNLSCSEILIKNAVLRNYFNFYDEFYVLALLNISEENYEFLRNHFIKSENKKENICICQEILSEILIEKYSLSHAQELFDLLSVSKYPKLRIKAIHLAKQQNLDYSFLKKDPDKKVQKALK